ncbi:MAG: DMT family transporter [Gammaproteobacteria bacterium]|nr:DMT family transporter [Gammaproteobacteria bacterium]
MNKQEQNAVTFALAAVVLWSTVATGFKLGLELLEPVQLLFLGTLVSTIIFVVAASISGTWQVNGRTVGESLLFGLINPFLYYLVLFEAYDRLPAQIAQPLNFTWAIVLAVLAVPLLKQPLSRRTTAGIALSYFGVVILLTQGDIDSWPVIDWFGVTLALASTLLWAGYWLLNTRSTTQPLTLMALSFLFATPLIGFVCILGPGLPVLSWKIVGYGVWVGLIEMGVTFLLWQQALRLTGNAGRIGQLIFLSPFLSLILIGTVLGERIHYTSVIGLGVIVTGLLVTGRPHGTTA